MAVLGRLLLGSAERLDLPDLLSIDSFAAGDFKYLIQSFIGSDKPYILRGFEVVQPQDSISTESISINIANSVVYYPTAQAGSFFFGLEEGNANAQPLVPELRKNATNFVYLTFNTFDTARDSRAFWDPDQNGGSGGEFSQDINTESVLSVEVAVSTSTFPEGTIPVCKVTVGSVVINSIQDCRDMMFRLGSGGVTPDPFSVYNFRNNPSAPFARSEPGTIMSTALDANPFQGGDKNIFTLKEWMDVVMTRIKEISGDPYWYSNGTTGGAGVSISDTWHDALGSTLKSKGEWIHDDTIAGRLTWTEDVQYHNLTDPRELIIRANTIDIANDGDVAYIELERDLEINNTSTTVEFKNIELPPASGDFFGIANGVVGAFANLTIGDWVKAKADEHYRYLRVEEFFSATDNAGSSTTAALAESIRLSDVHNVASLGVGIIANYTKGEYLLTDIKIDGRADQVVHDIGGNFFWLAYRSDTNLGLEGITPAELTPASTTGHDSIDVTEADGERAKCTSVAHGLIDGDRITITTGGYAGTYKVSVEDVNTFYINTAVTGDELNQSGYYAIVETRARATSFSYQLESANHGFESDQRINIQDTSTGYDGSYLISVRSDTTFQIPFGSLVADPGVVDGNIVSLVRVNVRTEVGTVKVIQGQEIDIGEPETTNILSYLGMPSLAVSKPTYNLPLGYNALNGQENYNSNVNDDITERVSKLTAMMADRVQDRGFSFRGRVNITSVTNAANQDVSATGNLTLHKPSSPEQTIDLTASIPANSAAIATIDRDGTAAITLSVISLGNSLLLGENDIIMFYRFSDTTVYTWNDEAIEPAGHINTAYPEDSSNRNISVLNPGFTRFNVGTGALTLEISEKAQQTQVTTIVGASVPQSSYFLINSAKDVTAYYVWYDVDALGTDPTPGGTGIQVSITSADTAIDVADATVSAINTVAPADFTADNVGGTSAVVTIDNDAVGQSTVATDINTTFAITTTITGSDPDIEVLINGSADVNTIDTDVINGLGTLILAANQAAWIRVNRFAAKTFNTILTTDTPDTDVAGAIYITNIVDVPIDQDVFVLWMRRGDNLVEMHKAVPPDGNIYDELIRLVAGAPANDHEVTGPVSSGTIFSLPLDGRDGNTIQEYIVGAGQLEIRLNGQPLGDEDWTEIGGTGCPSNQFQIDQALVVDDKLEMRISSKGSVFFASTGITGGTLQQAYDKGRFITINSGQPVVISGPGGEKLLRVLGDLDVTGVIDPTGLQLSGVASNPLSGFGIWTDSANDDLVYEGNALRVDSIKLGPGATELDETDLIALLASSTDLQSAYNGGNTIALATSTPLTLTQTTGGDMISLTKGTSVSGAAIRVNGATGSAAALIDVADNTSGAIAFNAIITGGGRGFRVQQSGAGSAAAIEAETNSTLHPGIRLFGTGTGPRIRMGGSTSGTLDFTVPASITNYTLTLPSNSGTANQFLQTNGSGVTSWATPAVGSTYTPSAVTYTNASTVTIHEHQYTHVGSIVTVSGRIELTVTTTGLDTFIFLDLPVATNNFVTDDDAHGTGILHRNSPDVKESAYVLAATGQQKVLIGIENTGVGTGVAAFATYTFQYEVQ